MHLYSTSQPGLSLTIIQRVRLVLGTDVPRTQGQRLCAQRKMFNIRHVNNVSVVCKTPTTPSNLFTCAVSCCCPISLNLSLWNFWYMCIHLFIYTVSPLICTKMQCSFNLILTNNKSSQTISVYSLVS